MVELADDAVQAFGQVAAAAAQYGRDWWEHDPVVDDLCRRVKGLRLRLYELQREVGEVTTADVYAIASGPGVPRWPTGWRTDRWPSQRAALRTLPRSSALLGRPPSAPSAYITLGLPGSGKTTSLRPIAWAHYESTLARRDRRRRRDDLPPGAAVLDADELRSRIAEYCGGRGSQVVQPETVSLTYGARQRQLLSSPCTGLLIDTVGDPATLPGTVARLNRAGYTTHLLLASVDLQVAERRAIKRAVTTGRVVPLEYLRKKAGVPERALEQVQAAGLPLGGWGIWETADAVVQLAGEGVFALTSGSGGRAASVSAGQEGAP